MDDFVVKALGWDSGDTHSISGSETDLLCEVGQALNLSVPQFPIYATL